MAQMCFAKWLGVAVTTLALPLTARDAVAETVDMALAGGSLIAAIPKMVDEMGFFAAHDIQPNFITMESSSAAATALMSGSVQLAFSGPGSLIAAQARGQDLVAIHSTYRGLGGTLVLSKTAADVAGITADAPLEDRLKALDGLNIATPSATSTFTLTFDAAADSLGAQPNFTYMAISTMSAALMNGAIDGYVASAPYWLVPVMDGSGVSWISGPAGELPAEFAPAHTAVTLATRAYVDEHKSTVDAVNAAFADFVVAIDERPEDVKAAIRSAFPDLAPETIDLIFASEAGAWKAGAITPEEIAHEVAFAVETNDQIPATVKDVDPARMVYP